VVVHHVDGDTLDVVIDGAGRERLRLIGINTPETKKPRSPVECFGPEASRHLAELLPIGSEVVVLRDVEARDDYGRFLAYLFRRSDGLFVNLSMAADGFARVLSIAPNTLFASEVSRAVGEARAARRGLWANCPDPPLRRGAGSALALQPYDVVAGPSRVPL
jgi:micrococcal nuclease